MTDALRIPSDRQPVVGDGGICTRPWYLFFAGLLARTGGVIGTGNEAQDMFSGAEGSSEMSAALYQLAQEVAQMPPLVEMPHVEALQSEVQALRDQVAELTKEIQGMRSGLTVL